MKIDIKYRSNAKPVIHPPRCLPKTLKGLNLMEWKDYT